MENFTRKQMKKAIEDKLRLNFGCTVEEATEANVMKACAMVLRDVMASRAIDTRTTTKKSISVRSTICPWSFCWAGAC